MKLKCMLIAMGLLVVLTGCNRPTEPPKKQAYSPFPSPAREEVFRVASSYIREQYPAVEEIDANTAIINNIWIGSHGGEWDFAIAVKGKNAYGVPTRNGVAGTLEWGGGNMWKLKRIENASLGSALK